MLLAAVLVTCGCTHLKLARSTLRQGSTLPDLHFQQVVDNLALFAANPDALAWHLKLKGGTVQITDLEAGVVGYDFRSDLTGLPGVNGQRTVLGQWDVEPATDADELEVLQLAYKKAVQPGNKDLDAEIRLQMWQRTDLRLLSGCVDSPGNHEGRRRRENRRSDQDGGETPCRARTGADQG